MTYPPEFDILDEFTTGPRHVFDFPESWNETVDGLVASGYLAVDDGQNFAITEAGVAALAPFDPAVQDAEMQAEVHGDFGATYPQVAWTPVDWQNDCLDEFYGETTPLSAVRNGDEDTVALLVAHGYLRIDGDHYVMTQQGTDYMDWKP